MRIICPHCLTVNNIPKKETYKKAICGKCKNSLLENKIIDLNTSNFDEILVNSDIPVIVDFWAPWCGPCKMFAPIFEKVTKTFPLKMLFTKVNTQDEQQLSARFNIRSIPTLAIYQNGKEIHRISGALDEKSLTSLCDKFIR